MRKRRSRRRGGAVVEAALTLPLVLLLVSASVELSTAIYLKESLTIAAYEGARIAITRKADNEDVVDRIEQVFTERGISTGGVSISSLVSISPAADTADILDPITITVSAPTERNCVVPLGWLQIIAPEELSASVVMRKEFTLETD
jgi:Flp pilus assembly protein TadG